MDYPSLRQIISASIILTETPDENVREFTGTFNVDTDVMAIWKQQITLPEEPYALLDKHVIYYSSKKMYKIGML